MTKFLFFYQILGASDHLDLLIPSDAASFSDPPTPEGRRSLADYRAPLYAQYAAAGYPRDAAALATTALTPQNSGPDALDPGRSWSLSPQMPNLAALFNSGNMAIVADIGPLIQPTTKADILNGTAVVPPALLSHNDQQAWIATMDIDGASPTGIGGRMIDLLIAKNALPADHDRLDSFAFDSSSFLAGANNNAFRLKDDGVASQLSEFTERGPSNIRAPLWPAERDAFNNMLRGPDGTTSTTDFFTPACPIEQALWDMQKELFEVGTIYTNWMAEAPPAPNDAFTPPPLSEADAGRFFSTCFPAIANIMARGESTTPVAGGLQHIVFHITGGMPGTDSHNNQAATTPVGQRYLDNFINAIYQAAVTLGIADDVSICIATEFGRTKTPNSSGTDHAWGGYQFWIGGDTQMANSGGRIIGGTPISPVFDPANPNDPAVPWIYNSRGYMIPRNAVEQAFANWGLHLGLTVDEIVNGIGGLPGALPNLGAFGATPADAVLPIL